MSGIAISLRLLTPREPPSDAVSADTTYAPGAVFGARFVEFTQEEVVSADYETGQPRHKLSFLKTADTDGMQAGFHRLAYDGGEWEIKRVDLESRPATLIMERVGNVS